MVAVKGKGWKLAPSLVQYVAQADRLYPGRDRTSDGSIGDQAHASRQSDHNPFEGWVHAVDLDEDIAPGLDLKAFSERLRASHDRRIRYVIYEARVFKSYASNGVPAWQWQSYTGPNAHLHHLHLSIDRTPQARDDLTAWPFEGLTRPVPEDDMTQGEHDLLVGTAAKVASIEERLRNINDWLLDPKGLAKRIAEALPAGSAVDRQTVEDAVRSVFGDAATP